MNILLVMCAFNIAHKPEKSLAAAFPYKGYRRKKAGPLLARLFVYGYSLISY
ncbi:hypothetical protein [Herminiimonas aquatilis]|uniref:Uncharacterized protein n=1 Tax=Herminiimonas aquatilis TaxID=345342 RepID=A0ABW2J103_9BURK